MGPVRSAVALLTTLLASSTAGATELSKETWDEAVAGKTVFVKFFAPWCGHCKRMKPDWDKLMAEFKDSSDRLIADVDCVGAGKSLCDSVGVRGYPTIKYGDPNDLQDYKGGRTLADLKSFAEGLGPQCGPANLDLCDAEKKKMIGEFQALSSAELEKRIAEGEKGMAKLESDFKTFVEGLQKSYEEANKKKEADAEALKNSGLGLMKSVLAHVKKGKTDL